MNTDTFGQLVVGIAAVVLLVIIVLALTAVVGGLLGAAVALSYNFVFAASFEVLPAAFTGSIVSLAAGLGGAGASQS